MAAKSWLGMAGLREEQVAWSLFDAGCWGYVSVTLSCLLPLVLKQQTPASIEKVKRHNREMRNSTCR